MDWQEASGGGGADGGFGKWICRFPDGTERSVQEKNLTLSDGRDVDGKNTNGDDNVTNANGNDNGTNTNANAKEKAIGKNKKQQYAKQAQADKDSKERSELQKRFGHDKGKVCVVRGFDSSS